MQSILDHWFSAFTLNDSFPNSPESFLHSSLKTYSIHSNCHLGSNPTLSIRLLEKDGHFRSCYRNQIRLYIIKITLVFYPEILNLVEVLVSKRTMQR